MNDSKKNAAKNTESKSVDSQRAYSKRNELTFSSKDKQSQPRRVVVITGASAGVGRAVVREFAKEGALIGLIARDKNALEDAKREVEDLGGLALVLPCDVSEYTQLEESALRVEREFGPIDVWVNVAMVSVFSEFKDMTSEEFKRVTEVTYLGYVYGTMCAVKRMFHRDRGRIIQVGSALAYRGIPLQSAYCGAKHAIQGFTESLRAELIHHRSKVKISMVQLPAVNTPQFSWEKSRLKYKAQPVPPIYQPEVPARAVHWISKHYRRELYVGLSTSLVINLNKFFPGIGDYYLGWTGFRSQQTKELRDPRTPDNLWSFVPTNLKAHGTFDDRAHPTSPQTWVDEHRFAALGVGVGLGLIAYLALRGSGRLGLNRAGRTRKGNEPQGKVLGGYRGRASGRSAALLH